MEGPSLKNITLNHHVMILLKLKKKINNSKIWSSSILINHSKNQNLTTFITKKKWRLVG